MERVQDKLKDLGRIPRDYRLSRGRRSAACTLSRTADPLVSRELEVGVVLGGLRQHRAAVLWGGSGEGKATVAMEAARRLRDEEPDLKAVELDMRGEAGPESRRARHAR